MNSRIADRAPLLPWSRYSAERGLALLTSGALCHGLVLTARSGGCPPAPWLLCAAALAVLSAAAVVGEPLLGTRLGPRYRTRPADSTGLCLGLLALPWALAGHAVQLQRWGAQQSDSDGFDPAVGMWLPAALAASAAAVLHRLLPFLWLALLGRSASNGQASSSRRVARKAATWQLAALAIAAAGVTALACAAAALDGAGAPAAAGPLAVLVLASASGACFHASMQALPRTFTPGEGMLLSHAAALLVAAAVQQGARLLSGRQRDGDANDSSPFPAFVVLLVLGSIVAAAALITLLQRAQQLWQAQQQQGQQQQHSRRSSAPQTQPPHWRLYAATAACVAAVAAAAAVRPALWLLGYALAAPARRQLLAYWAGLLALVLPGMSRLAASGIPNILVRKAYHLLALALFVPALAARQAPLLGAALAAAFALFAAAEVVRLSGLPRVAAGVHRYLTSFTDGRDSGLLLVTHFTLLLGMAAPLWLSNALLLPPDGPAQELWPAGLAGIIALGFGDTAASAVGRLVGRRPICRGSHKTAEGTAAACAATLGAWVLLLWSGVGATLLGGGADAGLADHASNVGHSGGSSVGGSSGGVLGGSGRGAEWWAWLAAATAASCLAEALTTQLDNLFVPLHYFALLCLLPAGRRGSS